MNKQFNFPEFANEAFEEINENIVKIRKTLLEIEDKIETHFYDKSAINDLLISFHTIKGISGMIGVVELQSVAHSVESFLKHVNNTQTFINRNEFELIINGVQKLEAMVSSLISEDDNYNELITSLKLDNFSKEILSKVEKSKDDLQNGMIEKQVELKKTEEEKRSKQLIQIDFIPSQELFNKGINVNFLRAELSNISEIVSSTPIKTDEGKVIFRFIISTEISIEEIINKLPYTQVIKLDESTKKQIAESTEVEKKEIKPKTSTAASNMVRVELSKLDDLMRMVGELVINRARLDSTIKSFQNEIPTFALRSLQETNQSMERQLRYLREGIMRVRLVPIGEVFDRMKFVVRDLIRTSNKQIDIIIKGKETEIDKYVVDKIFDPLMHIVRNSVSHGIELAEERVGKGKNEKGTIQLIAYTSGDSVVIEIEDDGKGIDTELIFKKGIEAGLINPNDKKDENTILNILCSPGFSTKETADLGSGRGVGMSSVKNVLSELGGTIELETEINKGTKWIIHIPLTLAIVDALIVQVGDQQYAIPQPSVNEVIEIDKNDIKQLQNNQIINYRGTILPIIYLSKIFKLKSKEKENFNALLIGSGKNKTGLVVDKIKTSREIVVHTITDPIIQSTGVSGATELGDGKAVLIIDSQSIIRDIKNKTFLN